MAWKETSQRQFLLSSALLSTATITAPAIAQNPPASHEAGPPAGIRELGDIVVTARRREEGLQDVPVAVSAFSGTQLEQQGVRSALDIARSVPSLGSAPTQNSSTAVTFVLRGQSASDIILTVDQAVGIYADGAYIPRPYGLQAGFVDMQSVEVLKGPQGTLYGRNTTGGAINLISRGPDFDGLHGYAYGEVGNHDNLRINGAVNIPLVDNVLAARIAYQHWTRDGIGRSRITGQDLGFDRNQQYLRGRIRFEPSDAVRIDFKADWTRIRENGQMTTARFYVPQAGTNIQGAIELGLDPANPADLATVEALIQNIVALGNADFTTSDTANILREDVNSHSFTLDASFDLADNIALRSVTSYRYLDKDTANELDGIRFHVLENVMAVPSSYPSNFPLPTRPMVKDRLWTQEINLTGDLFHDRLNFLVGVFYSNERGNDATQNDFRLNQFQLQTPPPLGNFVINFNEGVGITNKSKAIYTQNDFRLADSVTLTAGYRYTWETRGMTSALRRFDPVNNLWRCGFASLNGLITGDPRQCHVPLPRDKSKGDSYLLSANWKPTADSLLYIKTAKGFRGGGFQVRVPTAPNFQPETARDVEIGAKADFFDHRLRANIAAYRTKYKNKQESQIVSVPIVGNATIITNAASATIKGVEAELFARPIAYLGLRGTVSYLHGRYDSFLGALSYTGAPWGDASGERFAMPDWQYSLQARLDLPVADSMLGVQADWSWTAGARPSARQIDPTLPDSLTDSFVGDLYGRGGRASLGLLNLRTDLELGDTGVTISVFATNLLDKRYQIAAIPQRNTGGIAAGITGETRMIGLGLRKSFGAE